MLLCRLQPGATSLSFSEENPFEQNHDSPLGNKRHSFPTVTEASIVPHPSSLTPTSLLPPLMFPFHSHETWFFLPNSVSTLPDTRGYSLWFFHLFFYIFIHSSSIHPLNVTIISSLFHSVFLLLLSNWCCYLSLLF